MQDHALMSELEGLVSEGRNPRTMDIDLSAYRQIAAAVDRIVAAFDMGGRLVYVGAGTSGRLGVLDASECPPTFGVAAGMVIGLIAGGPKALTTSIEGAEDDPEAGAAALRGIGLTASDVVVGIAVSGRTPYVLGALAHARAIGAATVALSCNPDSAIAALADIAISPVVGPEVLTGSTRLKSGTAQKLVLNMLTTASMIRIGKTYQNLMVDVRPTNHKLMARAVRIVMQAGGCDAEAAQAALNRSGSDVKLAILVMLTGLDPQAARGMLARSGGFLRRAIEGDG